MCGIGGIVVYGDNVRRETIRSITLNLIRYLSARGTDASGIAAINDEGHVWIRKMPVHPHVFANIISEIRGWENARIILVHDRAWTTCPPSNNWCNHPLYTVIDGKAYILVHNGVIYERLPQQRIDVDSYVILATLEDYAEAGRKINDETIADALYVDGNMAILLATSDLELYVYRNHNPLAFYDGNGIVVFASTQEILKKALNASGIKPDNDRIRDVTPYKLFRAEIDDVGINVEDLGYVYEPTKYYYKGWSKIK